MAKATQDQARNQPGLSGEREKFIARAMTLLDDRAFQEATRRARITWNDQHGDHLVVVRTDVTGITPSPYQTGAIFPPSLARGLEDFRKDVQRSRQSPAWHWRLAEAQSDYVDIVSALCLIGWPPQFHRHRHGVHGRLHPGIQFVSAVLNYPRRLFSGDVVERLIPAFRLAVHSLPYRPDGSEQWQIADQAAQIASLEQVIRDGDMPSECKVSALADAKGAGLRARRRLQNEQMGRNSANAFLFVPLPSVVAANDLVNSASEIANAASTAGRNINQLDTDVATLAEEGHGPTAIARILGVHRTTVSKKLNAMKDHDIAA